jgi:hypothetical protein
MVGVGADQCSKHTTDTACYDDDVCCMFSTLFNRVRCIGGVGDETLFYPAREGVSDGCHCVMSDCSVPPAPTPMPTPEPCDNAKAAADCVQNANCCHVPLGNTMYCFAKHKAHPVRGYVQVRMQ